MSGRYMTWLKEMGIEISLPNPYIDDFEDDSDSGDLVIFSSRQQNFKLMKNEGNNNCTT
jgi:hypothetical protein